MASLTEQTYPRNLDDQETRRLVDIIKDWSLANGLAVRPPPSLVNPGADAGVATVLATCVPVTLFPSPFPKVCFEQAKSVQKAYNELYARISRDEGFISGIVAEVIDGDDFIKNLWDVHLKVKKEGYTQTLSLGLFRSDYMVHQEKLPDNRDMLQIKQVEFNTIASSFGGLSSRTSDLHRYLAATAYPLLDASGTHNTTELPPNESTQGLARGLKEAFTAYGKSTLGHATCVLFLVQDDERNVFDQRHLEYELQQTGASPVFRLSLSQILERTSIAEGVKRQLLFHLPTKPSRTFEVAVVYFRAGYGPGDYPDAHAWDIRYHIERSAAIKCPTVLTQLAGMKKVQQVLAAPQSDGLSPSVLGRFVPDGSESSRALRCTFTNIFPMDGTAAGVRARELATDPEACKNYVLKPQREGGGNNYYRTAIQAYLQTIPESHWGSYILMELITPPPVSNMILRNGAIQKGGVICELGRYGTCLWDQASGEILSNEDAGYLLRTKSDQSEEGGVAAGFGCMDSCNLI